MEVLKSLISIIIIAVLVAGKVATKKQGASSPNGQKQAKTQYSKPNGSNTQKYTANSAKKTYTGDVHSHDRLDNIPDEGHDPDQHWKQQLDGFLKAGLIDRTEYKALYEQRKACYHSNGEAAHKYN